MPTNKSFSTSLALLVLMPVLAYSTPENDSHMEWWRDARFGMFIHWGSIRSKAGNGRARTMARNRAEPVLNG